MTVNTPHTHGLSGRLVVLALALLLLPPVFAQKGPRDEGRATLAALKRAIELLHAKNQDRHVHVLKTLYGKIEADLREGHDKKDRDDRSRGDEEAKRRRYEEGAARIKEAIESGKISREDGEKRLVAMRRSMWPEKSKDRGDREHDERERSRGDEERKRRRYEEGAAKIREAVESGKISREDGEKRLAERRRRMWPEKSKDRGDRSRGEEERKRRSYEERATRIKEAIESGKISREDGQKRLKELKRRLWPDLDKKKTDAKKK